MSTKFSPKDFFFQISAFVALYVSVVSLLTLLFQYINVLFPDQLEQYYSDPYSSAIRFSIAALIVVFPLYIFFTRLVNKDLRQNPEKRGGGFRKWLIYVTLFVGGVTITVDLIVLINTFLNGELTTRFILKVLSILVIVGVGFWYYFYDLKGRWEREERQSKIIGSAISTLVVLVIIGGFFIIGSPQKAREISADNQRVQALDQIQSSIVNYWQQKETLPADLTALEDPLVGFVVPTDPETDESYEYRATGARSFELCAVFTRAFEEESFAQPITRSIEYPGVTGESFWTHTEGRNCFERTIDPDRFPPQKSL